ncbi:unnamed protein product [Effrenium voratum]|nr:unnamed protein product [Effrenium voratum]
MDAAEGTLCAAEAARKRRDRNAGLRFVCADHGFGALQIIFHAKGTMWPLHAGHAARWAANATATPEAEAKQRVEAYAMAALTASSSARIGEAEFLLGGASRDADPGDETSVSDRGPEVAHFLATLRLPAEARSQARTSTAGLVSAASHPSKSLFAAATEAGAE